MPVVRAAPVPRRDVEFHPSLRIKPHLFQVSTETLGLSPADLFDLARFPVPELLEDVKFAWEILPKIAPWLEANLEPALLGEVHPAAHVGPKVRIEEGAVIEPGAVIKGPALIMAGATVRSGAYVRENAIVGPGATIGNSCELKNCLVGEKAEVPHYNYVGDSILGYRGHVGAGVILSNVRLDRGNVSFRDLEGSVHETGLRKFGAIIGDLAEIGCNTVLSPGTVIGRESIVYPLTQFSGQLPPRSILQTRQTQKVITRR